MPTLKNMVMNNFRGVDFANSNVKSYRSPDALNVWKNYNNIGDEIETRPDIELVKSFDNTIYGVFFYKNVNTNKQYMVVHIGTCLVAIESGVQTTIKALGMNPAKSQSFYFGNKLYIKDGINYLMFDGTTCTDVVGYIPTTMTAAEPSGKGKKLEDINLLSDYRKNEFAGDGETTEYNVDSPEIDNVTVKIDGVSTDAFTVDSVNGQITFTTAPPKASDDNCNVVIQFSHAVNGSANKIKKCNNLQQFDNRVFFSGNIDYPNTVFHSSLNNPAYCSDQDFYSEGGDLSPVKAMIPGNNALWIAKEPSQANTTVYYHTPYTDLQYGRTYPNSHSNISTGCISTGINFNDDIVFLSPNGLEGISGGINEEQLLNHRSTLVDNKLTAEINYKNAQLVEWRGYLLIIIDNSIYLANSRDTYVNNNGYEYEWFYWEFSNNITYATANEDILYLCMDNKIYKLTEEGDITSYWTTAKLDFGMPQYNKVTNKRGFIIEGSGDFTLSTKKDNENIEVVESYTDITENEFIAPSVKIKKFRTLQLKISSATRFKLYNILIESYIGSYLKDRRS